MTRFPFLCLKSLLCGGLLTATLTAQPPFEQRGGPPQNPPPNARGVRPPEPKIDAQVEAWMKTLLDKINDHHDTIRDSARAAVVAVGAPALPLLRPLADASDAAKATAARKLIAAIEQPMRPPLMFAGGAMAGGPPFQRGTPIPMGPPEGGIRRGDGRQPEAARPDARPAEGDRRPEVRPGEGERRPENRPAEGGRRPSEGDRRPDARPMEGDRRPEARPNENRPREGERRPMEAARPGPGGPIGEILRDLNLNEKQRRQSEEILDSHRKKVEETTEKVRSGRAEPAAMREIRDGIVKEMKEVLSAEQFEKFSDALKRVGPPMGGPGGPGRPGGERRPNPDR